MNTQVSGARTAALLWLLLALVGTVYSVQGSTDRPRVAATAAGHSRHLASVAAAAALRRGTGGRIPQDIVDRYNPARGGAGGGGIGTAVGSRPRPPPPALRRNGTAPPPPPSFGVAQYKKVLGLSFLFYEAQRSGRLPATNRVPWRGNSHLNDRVPGGWHDAGDFIKPAYTIAQASLFLSWAAQDFANGTVRSGQEAYSREAVQWAADFLLKCSAANDSFIGLIGDPEVDHAYWGRPEQQTGPRKAFVWTRNMPAADLLSMTSAALASASTLFKTDRPTYARQMLVRAKALYQRAVAVPGRYSASYPNYSDYLYVSSRYADKMMLAAAWLGRATGNLFYFREAQRWYKAMGGRNEISPYVSWDDTSAPAAAVLVGMGLKLGAAKVPSFDEYSDFLDTTFLDTYIRADGTWGIVRTPKGLRYPQWSKWGNLRYACNAAFIALVRASQLRPGNTTRAAAIGFARSQVDYALGSAGRSFVAGFGSRPPVRPHHAAASCPDRPATCNWDAFEAPGPNPQVLYGALVAGPAGPGDNTYYDRRSDYVTNEVAIDYNAGFTAALAGLVQLLSR